MTQYNRKAFYRNALLLVIPVALQNIINVAITATDVLMMGRVGEKALSGVSLAGQLQFVLTLILFGLTSGLSVLTAQYWGKKEVRAIEAILGIALKLSVLIALLFFVAVSLFPEPLMRIFSNDPEVIRHGVAYLRIVAWSYPLAAISTVYAFTMRSLERVMLGMAMYLISWIINVIFNAIFIFGLLGAPAMGAAGAAVGTLMARVAEMVVVIFYDRNRNTVFRFKWRFLNQATPVLKKDFITYSAPVLINELLWGMAVSAGTAILGQQGSAVSAANSVAQVTRQLSQVLTFGVAAATAIMVGKMIGEGKREMAKNYARRFIQLSFVTGTTACLIILLVRGPALMIADVSARSRDYLSGMMLNLAWFVILQSFNTTMIVGVFRAGGDSKFGLLIDVVSMWSGSLIIGFLGAFVFRWPVLWVYAALLSDEIIKTPLSLWRYLSGKWCTDVTRDLSNSQ
ncbi:MAG: MATE family efflux transporter [Lachnospiraceae bacterium]|nr:MATE family efflux transporter [Lachnospiraceae bacterium]MDY5742791.1 MATE family efflux transporter [Lachnospiraceae bacterium]